MFKKIFDFIFFRSEYQVKFFSFFNFSFKVFYIVVLLFFLIFRFFVFLFQQVTNGFDNFAFLIDIFIVFLLFYPLFFVFRFVVGSFYTDVSFVYSVNRNLKCFCIGNKFVTTVYKPVVFFSFDFDFLYVRFRLDGHEISKKFENLSSQLSNMFCLNCVFFEIRKGYAFYKFSRLETRQFLKSELDVMSVQDTLVFITDRLIWDFRRCPHGLIVGSTGSGKTYFLSYLILSFLRLGCLINILDPKRSDLSYLVKYLGDSVQFEVDLIIRNLRLASEEMFKRYDVMRNSLDFSFGSDFFDYNIKPFFIVFDEVSAFMSILDKKRKDEVNKYLFDIILKGRQAGVFIIFTMQRADTEFIKGAIRDQLGLRVALGNSSNASLRMCFEDDYKDLGDIDVSIKGSGYIYIDGFTKKPVDFISPYLDIDFINEFEKFVEKKVSLVKVV
jgi:hypothetical protein